MDSIIVHQSYSNTSCEKSINMIVITSSRILTVISVDIPKALFCVTKGLGPSHRSRRRDYNAVATTVTGCGWATATATTCGWAAATVVTVVTTVLVTIPPLPL